MVPGNCPCGGLSNPGRPISPVATVQALTNKDSGPRELDRKGIAKKVSKLQGSSPQHKRYGYVYARTCRRLVRRLHSATGPIKGWLRGEGVSKRSEPPAQSHGSQLFQKELQTSS